MMNLLMKGYDSEEDADYNPTKKQLKEYEQEHMKRRGVRQSVKSTQELWDELQAELKQSSALPESKDQKSSLEIAKAIISSDSIKPNQKIFFAGKEFTMNEETGQLQIVEKQAKPVFQEAGDSQEDGSGIDPEAVRLQRVKYSYQYLNHVIKAIHNRSRKINSIGKSKLDWRGFVQKEGIEHDMRQNRKGGVIQDMQFLKGKA